MTTSTITDTAPRPYHHGDLKQTLLAEAERILQDEGIQALTLRAVARAAGVSHTAPKNHFDDLTGLLTELAADGYRRLAAALSEAMELVGPAPRVRLRAMGRAYLAFVRAQPGLFTLMFRGERLDDVHPSLQGAVIDLRMILLQAVGAVTRINPATPPLTAVARTTAVWSLVQGYAMLMIEGRLRTALAAAGVDSPEVLFEAVMDSLHFEGVDDVKTP